MKCSQCRKATAVATVQILHPSLTTQIDEICARCVADWENYKLLNPHIAILIAPIPSLVSRVAAAVLMVFSLAGITLILGAF